MTEQDYRRKDFVGGVPVTMADGQVWFLAEPRIRMVPSDSDVGFEQYLAVDDEGRFDRMTTEYQELTFLPKADFEHHAMKFVELEIKMARILFERNYDAPIDVIRNVLQISHDPGDQVAYSIRTAVIRILVGDSPKHSAGGGEPSPTPADSPSTTAC